MQGGSGFLSRLEIFVDVTAALMIPIVASRILMRVDLIRDCCG